MADYHERFSEAIRSLTKNEITWIRRTLGADSEEMMALEHEVAKEFGLEECNQWPPCGWEIQLQGRQKLLWLHDGDAYDDDLFITWVQHFLEKFRPDKAFRVSMACTVSRPLLGEFGGRWVYIAADNYESGSTWDQLERLEREGG